MSFKKEYIPQDYEELFNSFEIYDYHRQCLRKWCPSDKWLADVNKEIYFMYVGGSCNLEQDPQQYNLVLKNKKIVIFVDNYSSHDNWKLLGIYVPIELQSHEDELIELIKYVLQENHRVDISKSGYVYSEKNLTINNFHILYKDVVK